MERTHAVVRFQPDMFPVKALRSPSLVSSLEELERFVGPFVLIQRPPELLLHRGLWEFSAARTVPMTLKGLMGPEIIAMLARFDDLVVATLPPLENEAELLVGRTAECTLIIHDPSVSKRHAMLRWDRTQAGCSLQDLGSTNGTWVNMRDIGREEVLLSDADTIGFGDAQFVYLLVGTLQEQLRLSMAGADSHT